MGTPSKTAARGLTLADLERRRYGVELRQQRRNASAMRRVAARLPACVVAPDHCPLHNDSAAAAPARATAATTTSP